MPDPIHQLIDTLKQKGLSDEDLAKMLAARTVTESAAVFLLLSAALTDADLQQLEGMTDEKLAMQKADELFQLRTGMTVDELVQKIESGEGERALSSDTQTSQPAASAGE